MQFAQALREDILRIAKQAARREGAQLRKTTAKLRQQIASLRRDFAALRKTASSRGKKPTPVLPEVVTGKVRFSAKGLAAHRACIGFSADRYGVLVGCSGLSIYNYEGGKSLPGPAIKGRIAAARKLGKRAAEALVAKAES